MRCVRWRIPDSRQHYLAFGWENGKKGTQEYFAYPLMSVMRLDNTII